MDEPEHEPDLSLEDRIAIDLMASYADAVVQDLTLACHRWRASHTHVPRLLQDQIILSAMTQAFVDWTAWALHDEPAREVRLAEWLDLVRQAVDVAWAEEH